MSEEWRSVTGYEGHYEVSDRGRVRSLPRTVGTRWPGSTKRHAGKLLEPDIKKGHLRDKLSRYGISTKYFVHRLVLAEFAGPCPLYMEGRHLDGDPSNNTVANLMWGTPIENWKDRRRHGRAVSSTPRTNTSGHRGVSFERKLGKWHAYIGYEPRRNIGWFDTFEEACAARLSAEVGWKGSRPESYKGAQNG